MAKLKEAQVKARAEEKEIQRLKNEIAGSIALKELDANPTGSFASALRDLLHTGITKASQRAMFDLPALLKPANDQPETAPDTATYNALETSPAPVSEPESTPDKHPRKTTRRSQQ